MPHSGHGDIVYPLEASGLPPTAALAGFVGTNVRCPSELNALSFHGPSTMLHSGEVTYVLKSFAWAFRYAYTPPQSLGVVLQLLGPEAVRSQAVGIGVTWLSSLYRNQVGEYSWFIVICSSVELIAFMSWTTCPGNPVYRP